MTKLNKNTRKIVIWIARSYYEFKKSVEKYKGKECKLSEEELMIYFANENYAKIIKRTFNSYVNKYVQQDVWDYFYNNKKIDYYKKELVEEELEKWFRAIAKELGCITIE